MSLLDTLLFLIKYAAIIGGGYYATITLQPDILAWIEPQLKNADARFYISYGATILGGTGSGWLSYTLLKKILLAKLIFQK